MATDKKEVPSVRMVIQRYRHASLLVDESKVVSVGRKCSSLIDTTTSSSVLERHLGLLLYISFSKTATEEKVLQAAKTLLNMPVGTLGAWGDGSTTKSVLQLLSSSSNSFDPSSSSKGIENSESSSSPSSPESSPLSIILVPQANLIAKITKNGKSIQYRDQIAKEEGRELYENFCNSVQNLLLEHQNQCRGQGTTTTTTALNKKNKNKPSNNNIPDPSIPPDQLFRRTRYEEFTSFDEQGFPLTRSNGDVVTKSARKRLQKQYDSHIKRHEKYILKKQKEKQETPAEQQQEEDATQSSKNENDKGDDDKESVTRNVTNQTDIDTNTLDSSFIQLIKGTFGKRQGLELQSDMGPFCHVVEL